VQITIPIKERGNNTMVWIKPNEFYAIFRCTNVKYAKALVKTGNIMFNSPKAWVDIAKKRGQGQGDLYEGVFAVCSIDDTDSILAYRKKYDDVLEESDGKLIYFKRESVMNMPVLCFFILKQELFESPKKAGKQTLVANIASSYFQDFAENKTKDEVMALNVKDRPAIVVIDNQRKFIDKIKKKLISMGTLESEILIQTVNYMDKYKKFCSSEGSPQELFLKDKSFSYQAESRIVVNTRNKELIDSLVRKPINIGSIKKFAQMSTNYFEKGMRVEMDATVYRQIIL
jgi:hypothetical protein